MGRYANLKRNQPQPVTIMIESQSEDTEDKRSIRVLSREARNNPNLPIHNRDGYSYTVEIIGDDGEKVTRELFMISTYGSLNFNFMHYVSPQAEGDNFYKVEKKNRLTKEKVYPIIIEALKLSRKILSEIRPRYNLFGAANALVRARERKEKIRKGSLKTLENN